MQTPQPMPGIEKAARVQVQTAALSLQKQLPNFPLDSDQFKALSDAIRSLQKGFGKSQDEDREMIPAEIINMLGALGPGAKGAGAQALAGPPAGGPPGGQPPAAPSPPPM
jgi:hypothetical protein